jgi:hypothetical protein
MSAARMTTPMGSELGALAAGMGLLRRALTTSLTPRLRDLLTAAGDQLARNIERHGRGGS